MLFSDYLIAIMLLRRSDIFLSFTTCSCFHHKIIVIIIFELLIVIIRLINILTKLLFCYYIQPKLCLENKMYTHHLVPKRFVEFGLCHLFNLTLFIVVVIDGVMAALSS